MTMANMIKYEGNSGYTIKSIEQIKSGLIVIEFESFHQTRNWKEVFKRVD